MEKVVAIWHHGVMNDSTEKEGFPSDQADRFQVRMPKGLRDRIREAAEANNRSMNAEIVAALSQAYPATNRASEVLTELYNFVLHSTIKIDKYDRAVAYELFEQLGRQVHQLEKLAPPEEQPTSSDEIDAVLTQIDPDTGEMRKYVVEYKNSINHKDFAIQQLESYLKSNPGFSGGIIVVGDDRLKAAQVERDGST